MNQASPCSPPTKNGQFQITIIVNVTDVIMMMRIVQFATKDCALINEGGNKVLERGSDADSNSRCGLFLPFVQQSVTVKKYVQQLVTVKKICATISNCNKKICATISNCKKNMCNNQ